MQLQKGRGNFFFFFANIGCANLCCTDGAGKVTFHYIPDRCLIQRSDTSSVLLSEKSVEKSVPPPPPPHSKCVMGLREAEQELFSPAAAFSAGASEKVGAAPHLGAPLMMSEGFP